MSEIVGCFNERAQKLLELHLASGFRKYILMLTGKSKGNHTTLIKEGKDLVTYALINAVAIRKILKKYDKVCKFLLVSLAYLFKSCSLYIYAALLLLILLLQQPLDSLLQARAAIQVTSPDYAQGNSSKSLAY